MSMVLQLFTSFYRHVFVFPSLKRIDQSVKNGKKGLVKGRVTLSPFLSVRELDAHNSFH